MRNLMLSAIALLLITGCAKYDDTAAAKLLQVPSYTETGANTFGCLLNGTVWANFGASVEGTGFGIHPSTPSKVRASIFYPSSPADTLFEAGAQYSLVKKGTELREESMTFQLIKNGSLKGTHQLSGTNDFFRFYKIDLSEYASNARNPFTVVVNKDSVIYPFTHIVSGRFFGFLYKVGNPADSVSISGGVFDLRTP